MCSPDDRMMRQELLGAAATRAWREELGLDAGTEQHWFVEVTIESDEPGTRLDLDVYPEEWGFVVRVGNRVSSIRVTDQPVVHGADDHRLLAQTPHLLSIPDFLTALERRFGVTFQRPGAIVRSNLVRASATVRSWLAFS